MEPTLEEQILNAIELFHYSYTFRNSTFSIVASEIEKFHEVLPDLKVLFTSRVRTIVFARDSVELQQLLKRWNGRGYHFEYFPLSPGISGGELPIRSLRAAMRAGEVPVIALRDSDTSIFAPCQFYDEALRIAQILGSKKVFFPGPYKGVEANSEFLSHPTQREIAELLTSKKTINIGKPFLGYLAKIQENFDLDVILLANRGGSLFQEIFTHRGAGTLISADRPNIFRPARSDDVSTIALLIKPYVKNLQVLPISEAQIFDSLSDFFVYTVNDQIVATARLSDYGDACELGKICTLARFQRRGRARAISEEVISLARKRGKRWIFSLSTQERMWVFFRQLGFYEVKREELPETWRANYDFSRPSRAFRLDLSAKQSGSELQAGDTAK